MWFVNQKLVSTIQFTFTLTVRFQQLRIKNTKQQVKDEKNIIIRW